MDRKAHRRRYGERYPAFYMVATTLLVVVAFLTTSYYWQAVAARAGEEGLRTAMTATEAIKRLTAARGELARLHGLATAALEGGQPIQRTTVSSAVEAVRAELKAYRTIPFFSGEQAHQDEAIEALQSLDGEVEALLDHIERGDVARARQVYRKGLIPAEQRMNESL